MKALTFTEFGAASVLQYITVADPIVTAETVLVKTTYIGLNYADIYRRQGTYHLADHTPYIDGYEGIGVIVEVGSAVTDYAIGDRVMFVDVPLANAELVAVPVANVIRVPDLLSDQFAASIGLQGLTADFLAHDLAQNQPGDRVLIHGISGGVGQILSQMLTADGCQVYGVASTPAKQRLALDAGAEKVFLRHDDWAKDYHDYFATVFDGVGKTVPLSLQLTATRGRIVFYGMAGGNPPKVDPLALMQGSKSLMTGDLWDFLIDAPSRQKRAARLFGYVQRQQITLNVPTIFPLAEGAQAHEALEQGKVAGKILLQP
ncbi:oxidoreductase [Lactobacillus plantarum JDM1] [Lactiplantibacillus mudanjiangensis]|uniref:quinone oxidoreductase family protein n=1 Tax=Lactiplantibacillus mudanjiangensis TaxID=1296538 RepID=UPI0010141E9C|nr:quinone oxidoreductase [Lactiplantibacillus mudanjiangensis]VDG31069.1 oxidoreductase [Lactobacillus plantarum JDM1] [Lactiplantibacillus mudanjiangensis]